MLTIIPNFDNFNRNDTFKMCEEFFNESFPTFAEFERPLTSRPKANRKLRESVFNQDIFSPIFEPMFSALRRQSNKYRRPMEFEDFFSIEKRPFESLLFNDFMNDEFFSKPFGFNSKTKTLKNSNKNKFQENSKTNDKVTLKTKDDKINSFSKVIETSEINRNGNIARVTKTMTQENDEPVNTKIEKMTQDVSGSQIYKEIELPKEENKMALEENKDIDLDEQIIVETSSLNSK